VKPIYFIVFLKGGRTYLVFTITSSKVLIFDWKYLFIQKTHVGRSLVACPNCYHYIYVSSYDRNNVRQTTVHPKKT
jgi:hypothetical protein